MFKQILIGVLFVGVGGLMIYYSPALSDMFRVSWFEKNLGGSKSGYVLVGFGVMLIGLLIMFGVIPTSSPTENLGTLGTGA